MTDQSAGYILTLEAPAGPLSARNLEDYLLCPRKYLLSYFVARGQSVRHIGGPAMVARAVRAALVEGYSALAPGSPEPYSLDRLIAAFEEHWDGRVCADALEEQNLHRDALRMLQTHWEQPLPLGQGAHTDLRLEAEVAGHPMVAVADVASEAPPRVVRFTTSRRPPSPGKLTSDLSLGLLWLLGAQRLGPATGGLLVDLRQGRVMQYALDDAAAAALEARIADIASRIRRERDFPPYKGKPCHWCRSRADCPAWGHE